MNILRINFVAFKIHACMISNFMLKTRVIKNDIILQNRNQIICGKILSMECYIKRG